MTPTGVTVKGVFWQNEMHSHKKKMWRRQINAAKELTARDRVSQKHRQRYTVSDAVVALVQLHSVCVCEEGFFNTSGVLDA